MSVLETAELTVPAEGKGDRLSLEPRWLTSVSSRL